ncbi:MAG: 5-oxoprolinase subunit PxpB [Conexivisphaerales archaeon]
MKKDWETGSVRVSLFLNYTYVTFCDDVNLQCNSRVHALDREIAKNKPEWVVETVPSYNTLAIVLDKEKLRDKEEEAIQLIRHLATVSDSGVKEGREVRELHVRYGGEYGPDLKEVAREKGLTEDEVIEIHTSRVYTCYMLGFTPGFVYLGDVDERIQVERLKTPRTSVKGGSVGLAGKQTGFYGVDSPGGWRIIGRLVESTFDINRNPPSLVRPGDGVRFVRAIG